MDDLLGVLAALLALGTAHACWRTGARLARRLGKRAGEAAAGGALLLTAALVLLVNHFPASLPLAVVTSPLLDLEFSYFLPPVLLFFGLAAARVPMPSTRRLLALLGGVIALYGALHLWLAFHARALPDLDATPPRGQVARQHTGWSCGAAACATLMKSHGIASSEREMGELCRTLPFRGTTMPRFVRGLTLRLRREGSPLRVLATDHVDVSGLDTFPKPCIVGLKLSTFLDHAVVVFGRDAEGRWLVGDPIPGAVEAVTNEEFARRFTGDAVALIR